MLSYNYQLFPEELAFLKPTNITHIFYKNGKNSSNIVNATEKNIHLEHIYLLSVMAKINYANNRF